MIDYPIHFIDVETTHLNPEIGEIIQICIVSVDQTGAIYQDWTAKIRPLNIERADLKSLQVNGYTKERWHGTKPFAVYADKIYQTLKKGTIIGHNIKFDQTWINYHLSKNGYGNVTYKSICTQQLAREHLPFVNVSLNSCRAFFSLDQSNAHNARWDVLHCRILFLKLWQATTLKRLFWRLKWILRHN